MMIALIETIVKQPATLLKTKWGDKYKTVLHDGRQDIEIWKKDESLCGLMTGQSVTIAAKPATRQDGSSYTAYEVVGASDAQPAPTNGNGNGNSRNGHHQPAPSDPVSHPAKPPLNADVKEWISIFDELKAALPQAQESTWRAAASTLFIQRLHIRQDFNNEVF